MCSVALFSKYEHFQIEELCRICLTKKEEMILTSEDGLADMLSECASVHISQEDGSCFICNYCASEVSRWFVFRQQVIKSFEIGKWLIKQKAQKESLSTPSRLQSDENESNAVLITTEKIFASKRVNEITSGNNIGTEVKLDPNSKDASDAQTNNIAGFLAEQKSQTPDISNVPIELNACKGGMTTSAEDEAANEPTCEYVKISKNCQITCEVINDNTKTDSEKNVSCKQCGQLCVSVYDLSRHKKTHKAKKYECSKCGKCFKQSQTLTDHIRRHYDSRNYACEICEKKFYKLFNVTEHMRIHTGERPFKCEYCAKTFTRGLLLRNHIKKAHTGEKRFCCEVCSKSFVDGYQLKIHMRTHTGEKPFPCEKCDKAFAMQGQLKSHVKYKHTLEKDFICNICGRTFTAKHTLDEHLRTHTGEKREPKHTCGTCGKKCITTTQLKIHIKSTHTGERPFPCQICAKSFVTRTAMESHLRTHTGEKSFVCCSCGKAFGAKSSLKIHERIHSGERPFECTLCGKSFAQGSTLKTHMRVHK